MAVREESKVGSKTVYVSNTSQEDDYKSANLHEQYVSSTKISLLITDYQIISSEN